MAFVLKFEEDALREWKQLDKSVRDPLRKNFEAYLSAAVRLEP